MNFPVPPVLSDRLLSRFRNRERLLVQVHMLRRPGTEVLRASICMVRHFRLAHLLPDFSHEYLVQLAAESTLTEGVAELVHGMSILGIHVFYDIVEGGARAQAFVVFGAILAAIHLRLVPRGHRLGVGIALYAETRDRHMTVHQTGNCEGCGTARGQGAWGS